MSKTERVNWHPHRPVNNMRLFSVCERTINIAIPLLLCRLLCLWGVYGYNNIMKAAHFCAQPVSTLYAEWEAVTSVVAPPEFPTHSWDWVHLISIASITNRSRFHPHAQTHLPEAGLPEL